MSNSPHSTSLTAAELDVCVSVGTRLGRGEIDALLPGWVTES